MRLFDTHAHLSYDDLASQINAVLTRAAASGVEKMLAVGTSIESSRACIALAEKYPAVYASVGIHPNDCADSTAADFDVIAKLAEHPRVRAIGETGLDCYWKDAPLEKQREFFRVHIGLSRQLQKPFIVHLRDSEEPIRDELTAALADGPLLGVMHSFTGDLALAQFCLNAGLYISFAGMATFKNAANIREIAAQIPADRILVETDSPFLTPHPHRGVKPNEPAMIVHTATCLAASRGVSLADFAEQTTQNAFRLFGISGSFRSSDAT
jgi:TatD DNase family protein